MSWPRSPATGGARCGGGNGPHPQKHTHVHTRTYTCAHAHTCSLEVWDFFIPKNQRFLLFSQLRTTRVPRGAGDLCQRTWPVCRCSPPSVTARRQDPGDVSSLPGVALGSLPGLAGGTHPEADDAFLPGGGNQNQASTMPPGDALENSV